MKIFDAFTFNNELSLLHLRLEELYDVVDQFIIVEGTKTHSGESKRLFYEENKWDFERFHHKITHIIVDDWPEDFINAWQYENFQRQAITRGLQQLEVQDYDIVFISDVDEIPNKKVLSRDFLFQNDWSKGPIQIGTPTYYYYFNQRLLGDEWCDFYYLARVGTWKQIQEIGGPQPFRLSKSGVQLREAGWHFSFLNTPENIQKKIKTYAHQEFNKEEVWEINTLKTKIKFGKDILNRPFDFGLESLRYYSLEERGGIAYYAPSAAIFGNFPQYLLDHYEEPPFSQFIREGIIPKPEAITIIIGCYNYWEYTKRCLQAILDAEPLNVNTFHEIYVHSNGSTDGTMDGLREFAAKDPRIKFIETGFPLGFARAYNFPIQFSQQKYVCLMNNDCQVYGNWLDRLMLRFDEDPKIKVSAVAPIHPEDGIVGFECVVIEKQVFSEIGLLNESFKMAYGEDEEFCNRLKNAGYKAVHSANTTGNIKEGYLQEIDFPIRHESNTTTMHLVHVPTLIQENDKKRVHFNNAKEGFVFFVRDIESARDFMDGFVNTVLAYHPESVVLLIASDFGIVGQLHASVNELYKEKIFLIPVPAGSTRKERLYVAANFFKNKKWTLL